jgi:hypothetical protein
LTDLIFHKRFRKGEIDIVTVFNGNDPNIALFHNDRIVYTVMQPRITKEGRPEPAPERKRNYLLRIQIGPGHHHDR